MKPTTLYFALAPSIYAAHFNNSIIILDSSTDSYVSLIDASVNYLSFILENEFIRKENVYESLNGCHDEQLDYWIAYFISNHYIVESSQKAQKKIAQLPNKPGGLKEYKWDSKSSLNRFKHCSLWQVGIAFIYLAKIHRTIKHRGIQGVLDSIKKYSCNQSQPLSQQEMHSIAMSIDAAALIYPKKTFCLAWATTFVLLALKNKRSCNLAIGIQTNPFYAHAWAESSNGSVIHDDPEIAQVLSIILREPC